MTAGEGSAIATSRVSRGAALGKLAAKQTLRRVIVKAGTIAVSETRREQLLSQADQRMARDFAAVLGQMRGAAMKIGQLLSIVDLGIVDERSQDAFRRQLAKLQDSVDAMHFDTLRPVIESELGPLEGLFASFDPDAFAAASIGQVYRARTMTAATSRSRSNTRVCGRRYVPI
ncbi:AarF/ABC1/UbiB kinase family protein [Mycolicibacterium farcinogenes]|nr:AarF/ABC1/UbiB kinase family protein [Mycolicibacterium farcinogenes]